LQFELIPFSTLPVAFGQQETKRLGCNGASVAATICRSSTEAIEQQFGRVASISSVF
jgi:hypothetical protein